jgi:CsoR family transcriptional regulator, copper-sensing transcriptional repressor
MKIGGYKKMHGYNTDKEKILTRLRRIEGQTRGLQRLIEEDTYCVDILTQVASVQAALEQVSLLLMEDHMRHCVTDAIQQGNGDEKIEELMKVLKSPGRWRTIERQPAE